MIFVTDAAGRGIYASRQLTEYIGSPVAEGTDYLWLDFVHPEDREIVRALMAGAFRARCAVSIRFRLLGREGRTMWVAVDALPSLGPSSRTFNGFIGSAQQIADALADGLGAHGSLGSFLPLPESSAATPDSVLTQIADHLIAEHRSTASGADDGGRPRLEVAMLQVGFALAHFEKAGSRPVQLH